MSTERVEVAENEVEVADSQMLAVSDIASTEGMDAIIAVGAKMEAFTKAMDTILNAVIKRSYVGDWVCHNRQGDKPENFKANIGSAAAERIATFLGIQERNWTPGLKVRSDDGQYFTWSFEADFGFGKRWIHSIGRASSQDKFFGYANGEWKALEDVKEDDIRMAAFRACRKEGVRGLLGLRSIPISKLKELGYNVDCVRYVNFESKMSETDKKAAGTDGLIWKEIKVANITKKSESKDPKKPWILWTVSDGKLNYSMFASIDSQRLVKLQLHQEDQTPIKIAVKVGTYNGQEQYSIEKVEGEEASK
jgi:hypothetical protein